MSEGDSVGESVHGKPSVVYRFFTRLGQIYQSWLDKSTPYTAVRWVVTLGLSFVYMIRVYLLQMTVLRYPPNRTRNSAPSFEGFQSLNFGMLLFAGTVGAAARLEAAGRCPVLAADAALTLSPHLKACGYQGHPCGYGLYFLRRFQRPGVLADSGDVLHHALLYHDEEANQAHD
ncbi:protein RER1 isoform X8 [Pan troglodytes]